MTDIFRTWNIVTGKAAEMARISLGRTCHDCVAHDIRLQALATSASNADSLTLDAGDIEFLAARLRRLFNHFAYTLPEFAKDDKQLIGIAPTCIGAVLANLAADSASNAGEVEPIAWEATTVGFIRFLTDSRYKKLRPEHQRWYRPVCSNAGGAVVAGTALPAQAGQKTVSCWIHPDTLAMLADGKSGTVWAHQGLAEKRVPLYTHPAPASKEPVADERCNRCGHENHSGSCVNVHPDKTPIKQESTLDGLRDCLQKMVDANLEDSLGPNHLALCLKQMAYEALELTQKVQPVADERAAWDKWVKKDTIHGGFVSHRDFAAGFRAALATVQTDAFIPTTPQEMIEFIGSNFDSMQADQWTDEVIPKPAGDLSNVRYSLTVHDLLSAFDWAGLHDAAMDRSALGREGAR